MKLYRYRETFWPLNMQLDSDPAQGVFGSIPREGSDWLAKAPPEVRKKFSELGHQALSERGVDWHSLGGIARARRAIRRKGRFTK